MGSMPPPHACWKCGASAHRDWACRRTDERGDTVQGVKAGEDIPEGDLVQVPCGREGAVVRQGGEVGEESGEGGAD